MHHSGELCITPGKRLSKQLKCTPMHIEAPKSIRPDRSSPSWRLDRVDSVVSFYTSGGIASANPDRHEDSCLTTLDQKGDVSVRFLHRTA
jgi:hypothetical protein